MDVEQKVTLEVMNPKAEIEAAKLIPMSPSVADLKGKRIGLVDNTKIGSSELLAAIGELLQARFPDAKFKRFGKKTPVMIEPDLYKDVARESDAVVLAVGD